MTVPVAPGTLDLNETIRSAVNARIEAEVARALSGDEVMGQFVAAALQQVVTVKDRDGWKDRKVPFLTHTLETAIRDATKQAVVRFIADEMDAIETEVRKALRRNLSGISAALAQNLADSASRGYGVSVAVELKTRNNG